MSLSRVVMKPHQSAERAPDDGDEIGRADALASLSDWLDDPQALAHVTGATLRSLVRDLSFAAAALVDGARSRAVVPTEPGRAAWEMGLERDDEELLVTVFRSGGAPPEVLQTARPIAIQRAGRSLLSAANVLLDAPPCPGAVDEAEDSSSIDQGLSLARQELARALGHPASHPRRQLAAVEIAAGGSSPLAISAVVKLRRGPADAERSPELAQSDLHALLQIGDVEFRLFESTARLRRVHVFLLAEQLLALSHAALDAAAAERALLRRVRVGDSQVGVRGDPATGVILLGSDAGAATWSLPAVRPRDLARSACRFAADVAKAMVAADRTQGSNLRLAALQDAARQLRHRLRPTSTRRSVVNRAPESYRAFAASDSGARRTRRPERGIGKLRFTESWRAAVGALDLRSVLLCGDRLIVGSRHELACLERSLGLLLWRRPARRAVSIMTPRGLARLAPDGRLELHSVDDGEIEMSWQLEPCVGAATSGAVVNAPALPPLLLVAEGAQHLAALDLDSGEIRWRRSLRRRGALRLRRAGKLMIVAAGSPELQALDLLTGEVVWRRCGSAPYAAAPAIDGGCLLALQSSRDLASGPAVLERIDPWSGTVVWSRSLPRPVRHAGPPRLASNAALLITEDDDRLGLIGLSRETGELLFDLPGGLVAGRAACLVVDDTVIASGASGQLVAVDAADGRLRYRHVFSSWYGRESLIDQPQSYQPVLRSGALFIPQSQIHVVRPQDGIELGYVPCDLVPDLLRVDECCGVYAAEASGHIAAYAAQPSLRLITTVRPEPEPASGS